ncbi:MAG TPA: hypothetical protein VF060_29390, partial [Trebonia sp.]
MVEPDDETLGVGAGALLFGDPAGAVDPEVPVLDVPVLDVPVPDVPVPEVPVPEVPLPEVLEPELADPVPDGEGLGEGLVLGLLVGGGVEGGVLDEVGCGAPDDVDVAVGDGFAVGEGEDSAAAVPADVELEGAHDVTGADASAMYGTSELEGLGAGDGEPILAGCAAAACEPLPPSAVVPELVVRGSTDWHCGPGFGLVGATECVALEVPEAVIVPGLEPPGGAAEPGPGIPPLPLAPVPSTLAAWPPVSTLELTCTTACRSGATASVALTANATP